MKGYCHCQQVQWTFTGAIDGVTACNCTVCRRYGVLWLYGHEGVDVTVTGKTEVYLWGSKSIGFHFCGSCGCVAFWRQISVGKDGKRRLAVNVRLAEKPDLIMDLPIDHFDGFDKFEDIPRDGKCVRDLWA